MKIYLLKNFCFLALLLVSVFSFANNIEGGNITFKCLYSNHYEVKLELYGDCNGALFSDSLQLDYSSASCGVNASILMMKTSSVDISPFCASVPSSCNGGIGASGQQLHTYTGILILPSGCNDWNLSYTGCCRSAATTNLLSPSTQPFHLRAQLNNTLPACDNSPIFITDAQTHGCVGQVNKIQSYAFDPDGDSLVYSLVDSRQSASTSANYVGGFSGTNPFTAPATINSQTGEISFTPAVPQIGSVTVLIREYRSGVLIGSVMRELQYTVENCTNAQPVLSGIDGVAGVYQITGCIGVPICFTVNATDADAGQNITMSVSNSLLGSSVTQPGTFTQSGTGNSVSGELCWTPSILDAGTHNILITATDDGCPTIGQTAQIYTLIVLPINGASNSVNITPSIPTTLCEGCSVTLNATQSGAFTISSVSWTPTSGLATPNALSTLASPSVSSAYTVQVNYTNGCYNTQNTIINVAPVPNASILQTGMNVCSGASVQLTGTTNLPGMAYQWFDPSMVSLGSGTLVSLFSNINVSVPNASGSYTYTFRVTNPATGCFSDTTITLTVGVPPALTACLNIYVSTSGLSGNPGTPAAPTTLAQALTMAACNNTVIKLATGTYSINNPIFLSSYLTLEGGFLEGSGWVKTSLPGATTINRTTANPEGAVNSQRLVAIYGVSLTGFRLQDLTITTSNANQSGMSTYGIHLTSCSDYNLVRTQILPGIAFAGANGVIGAVGNAGRNGGYGSAGDIDNQADRGAGGGGGGGGGTTLGVIGGNASGNFNTANNCTQTGGLGGAGGTTAGNGGNGTSDLNGCGCCSAGTIGGAGTTSTNPRSGGGGGGGGSGGEDITSGGPGGLGGGVATVFGTNNSGGAGGAGGDPGLGGSNGGVGLSGPAGATGAIGPAGTHVLGFWIPGGSGGNGVDGSGGQGGRGGGGGGGQSCTFCVDGAGCGGGGQGGGGGTGGLGGGGSFGLYLFNNGANGNVVQSRFVAGSAGAGGIGGPGGSGGFGGAGGPGSPYGGSEVGVGGNGGAGGSGGSGGSGGTGQTGVSLSLYLNSGSPLSTAQSNFNLAIQPTITASDINCVNSLVNFTHPTPITWDFSANATPQSPVGTTVNTQFNAVNRYTVAAGANSYEGFHNISFANTIMPVITSNADVVGIDTFKVCVGTQVIFGSPISALSYAWSLTGGVPSAFNTQVAMGTFSTPGFYPITLSLTTTCCGVSPTKTVYLYAIPNPFVIGSGNASICAGTSTLLSLIGVNPADSVIWTPGTSMTQIDQTSISVYPTTSQQYVATVISSITAGGQTVWGCPKSIVFQVTVAQTPSLSFGLTSPTCNNSNGSIIAYSTVFSNNFFWSNGFSSFNVNSSNLTNIAAGTYMVTVVSNSASICSSTASVILPPSSTQPSLFVVNNNPSCSGQNNGSITVGAQNGVSPYTYTWISPPLGTGNTKTGLTTGPYVVNVTDGLGCQNSLNIFVFEQPGVSLNVLNNGPICSGGTGIFTLAGETGYTVVYNVGAGNVTLNFTSDTMQITLPGIATSQTLNLVSVTNGICTNTTLSPSVLQVNPIYNITQNINACENSTVTYPDGSTAVITGNTSHTSNLLTAANCDSIITTNVTMDPVYNINQNVSACQNSTVTYPDGTTATITGNTSHISNLLTAANCDSIITTNVTMIPSSLVTQNLTACQNSIFTYPDGFTETITANSSHVSTLVSSQFCDSIITTNVTMLTVYNITSNVSVCPNATYTYPDGTVATITASTSQTSTLISSTLCDSIIVTNITVNPVYNITQNVNACENSTITYPDGTTATITANTSHISNLLTADNCDSIITTNVTMDPVYNITQNINACENSTVTYPDGSTAVITGNTSHTSNLLTAANCDSIITTNVTMDPVYNITQNVSACQNSTVTYPDGTTATITGNTSHVSNLLTTANCDSIITTNVTMVTAYNVTSNVSVCPNATYTYPDGTVATITASTSQTSTLISSTLCDSIIVTNITVNPVYNITQNVNACENSTVTYPDGTTATITANTSHISNLLTVVGACDSIITTNVTMDPIYSITQNINA